MLSFNIADVKKFKDNYDAAWVTRLSGGVEITDLEPMTKGFVFWGGVVSISSITKSNANDYYARSKIIEKFADITVATEWSDETNNYEPIYITPQMVYEMIGLSTNHSQHNFSEWFARQKRNTPNLPSISITRAFHAIEKYNYDQWKNSLETL
jgi:hypothetical protein